MMTPLHWREFHLSPLWLGTVQLGIDYGIANTTGQPSEDQAIAMVQAACDAGITVLDTAQAYGSSEERLGKALFHIKTDTPVHVVSKLHPNLASADEAGFFEAIAQSVNRIGQPLLGMMCHRASWLDHWDQGLGAAFNQAKENGLIHTVGCSVYTPDEARRALEHPQIDMVQLPFNAWDVRWLHDGIFELANSLDKLCVCRSVYLQGLLVMSEDQVRETLPQAEAAAVKWTAVTAQIQRSKQESAVSYARHVGYPLVIGAETVDQVQNNALLFEKSVCSMSDCQTIQSEMAAHISDTLVDPSTWGT